MKAERFLFLSGPEDGEWKENFGQQIVKVVVLMRHGGVEEFVYEAHRFIVGGFETFIYVLRGQPLETAFQNLLAAYRPTKIRPYEAPQTDHQQI